MGSQTGKNEEGEFLGDPSQTLFQNPYVVSIPKIRALYRGNEGLDISIIEIEFVTYYKAEVGFFFWRLVHSFNGKERVEHMGLVSSSEDTNPQDRWTSRRRPICDNRLVGYRRDPSMTIRLDYVL